MIKSIIGFLMLSLLSSCAWIVHGTKQDIDIISTPPNATVSVDYQIQGKTPLSVRLIRDDIHIIKIELEGYQPMEIELIKETDGWFWGNLFAPFGMAIDYFSGSMYKLTPEQINVELKSKNVSKLSYQDKFFISVVLNSDPSWEKIGMLKKN